MTGRWSSPRPLRRGCGPRARPYRAAARLARTAIARATTRHPKINTKVKREGPTDILVVDDERDIRAPDRGHSRGRGPRRPHGRRQRRRPFRRSTRPRPISSSRYLAQGQPARRHRHPEAGAPRQSLGPDRDHLGSRQYRDRRRRHQAGAYDFIEKPSISTSCSSSCRAPSKPRSSGARTLAANGREVAGTTMIGSGPPSAICAASSTRSRAPTAG